MYRGGGVCTNSNCNVAFYAINIRVYDIGPVFNGREETHDDGPLHLKKVTRKDTSYYTKEVYLDVAMKEIGFGWLWVYCE